MRTSDLHVLRIRLRAAKGATLPCLPTVALRSVVGMTLRELSCVQRDRSSCSGCPARDGCAYSQLLEPAGDARSLGVTDVAPPPLVLAPEARTLDEAPIRLADGGWLDVRAVFFGRARAHASLLVAAMRAGLARGVGRERVAMEVLEAQPVEVTLPSLGTAAELELWTPLRLVSQGKIRSRFTAQDFVQGLTRRVQVLSQVHGSGEELPPPTETPLDLECSDTRVVHVRRWSARQKAGMDLPGLMGRIVLRGDLSRLWPWLALGEWVQVGKGTSMGFGRYRLRAVG